MENRYIIREPDESYALERLYNNLPKRPYCSNSKRIRFILPKERAINYRYIQINHPLLVRYIVFDLDYQGSAFAWDEKGLPPFTYVVINRQNAHCHGIYEIDPVFMGTASEKTLKLLKKVTSAYRKLLEADKIITTQKQLIKNPFHKDWELICNGGIYTLSELAEYIKCNKRKKKQEIFINIDPSGRNVTLFNKGRYYAYEIVSQCTGFEELYIKVKSYLKAVNTYEIPQHFQFSLPYSEIKTISKSISKWVWERRNYFRRKRRAEENYNIGVMGFEKIKNLPYKAYKKEVKRRQSLAGKRTSMMRRKSTLDILTKCYMHLLNKLRRVTQKIVSKVTGYSIRTVKYYWHYIVEGAKRSIQGNSKQVAYGSTNGGTVINWNHSNLQYIGSPNYVGAWNTVGAYAAIIDTG